MERHCFWRTRLLGQEQVPDRNCERAVLTASYESRIRLHIQAGIAKPMQDCEIVEGGFGNAVLGEQAEPSIKRCFDYSLFFEYVGEGPVAHAVDQSVALSNSTAHPGPHKPPAGHLWLVLY